MKFKRITALFLAMIIFCSFITSTSALTITDKTKGDFFNGIIEAANEVKSGCKNSENSGKPVARVWLVSTKWIHIFVYIKNISKKNIKVGLMDCKPGQGVSVGTFGLTRSDGFGLYYNIESYCLSDYDHYDTLCCDIDAERLAEVNDRIINHNHWDFIVNCAFFACAVWNTASNNRYIVPFTFSPITKLEIMILSDGKLPKMSKPKRKNVCKQRGSGSDAYLEVCSDDSIHD